MRFLFLFSLLVALSCGAYVYPRANPDAPRGWTTLNRSPADRMMKLIFAVKRENMDELRSIWEAVSDPRHDRYGAFLSHEELNNLIAPSRLTLHTIKTWLRSNGISLNEIEAMTPNSDYIRVPMKTSVAENLLGCEYWDYGAPDGRIVMRVKGTYSLPSFIGPLVDFVAPGYEFPPIRFSLKRSKGLQAGQVTPTFLRSLYNVSNTKGTNSYDAMQGIASFVDEFFDTSDVEAFWKLYNLESCNITQVPEERTGHGLEAELDVEYITAMGEHVSTEVWYTQTVDPSDIPLLSWLSDIASNSNPPLIFSASYGVYEKDMSVSYANRVNDDFSTQESRGLSFLFASGDSGAGGECTGAVDTPDFPAALPTITAVGGLHGGTAGDSPTGETCWDDGGSGFSNYFGTPSWQEQEVKNYLDNTDNLPPTRDFNTSGRGYPDIAAQSVDYNIVVNGVSEGVSGTSCSSPTSAGMFGLLNDMRIQAGMSSLGFLNPIIYQIFEEDSLAFNDCTKGQNAGCEGNGFPTAVGWDAATGVGSPNFGRIKEHVMKLGEKTKRWHR